MVPARAAGHRIDHHDRLVAYRGQNIAGQPAHLSRTVNGKRHVRRDWRIGAWRRRHFPQQLCRPIGIRRFFERARPVRRLTSAGGRGLAASIPCMSSTSRRHCQPTPKDKTNRQRRIIVFIGQISLTKRERAGMSCFAPG